MIKKGILGLLILFFCLSGLSIACENPEANMELKEDSVLCGGKYKMDAGLKIAADNINVECNGTRIVGYDNEEAFSIVNKDNVSINGCEIKNFQIGVRVTNSDSIVLSDSYIINNKVGILMEESNKNVFQANIIENSTDFGVYLDNKSRVNTFRNNRFHESAFNLKKAANIPYNNYKGNEYINTEGPSNYSTNYEMPEEPKQEEEEKSIETFDTEDYYETDKSSGEDFMKRVYEAKDLNPGDYLERDLQQIQKASEKIDATRKVTINHKENTTTFKNTYTAKENVTGVQIYEYVPKSIASDVSELEIMGDNYTVLEADPLIMWKKESMKAGEEVETSYKVNKVVKEEKPDSTVCIDCTKKKRSYSFIIPLLLIPVIVFGFIIFDRMQKNPEK